MFLLEIVLSVCVPERMSPNPELKFSLSHPQGHLTVEIKPYKSGACAYILP